MVEKFETDGVLACKLLRKQRVEEMHTPLNLQGKKGRNLEWIREPKQREERPKELSGVGGTRRAAEKMIGTVNRQKKKAKESQRGGRRD